MVRWLDSRAMAVETLAGKAASALLPMLLLGCSSLPLTPGAALAQTSDAPSANATSEPSVMDSQLMFELMIAELAGRRGQLDVALAGYLRAARDSDDPRVSERATQLAMFGRQWADAEDAARRWRELDPDSTEAPGFLGQALLRQDKVDEASELYIQLLAQVPADSDERRQLLRDIQFELQQNENPAMSVSVMQSLVDTYGDEVEAHLGLARAHITNSDTEAALLATEQALQVDAADTDALMMRAQILAGTGEPDEAFSLLESALADNPDNTTLRLGFAQLLVEGGRYEQLDSELARIFDESADNPDTLLTISLLAIEARRLEQARTFLAALLESGDYPDQANFYLARISDDQKEYEQAIAFYDAVGEGDLQFNSLTRAAELTALTGDLEAGRSRLRELSSLAINPALQPRLVTAESRMLQNANQPDEAVSVLNDGLQQFPENQDLLYARALAAHSAGDDTMMIDDLNRVIELDPNNAHALNALGYHFVDENIELDKAEELLVKANELMPDDPAIMDSLGWLRFRQARYEEAIALLRSAYTLFPDPEIAAHLVEALWINGAQGEARELIEQALESSPDDERLLTVQENVIK